MITGIGIGIPFKVKRGNALSGWSTLTDGTTTLRKYIQDGYLYVDKTLTALGFGVGCVEGVDWENVKSIEIYWVSRFPSDLVLTVDSDTQITLDWVNNGIKDYDNISIQRADTDPTADPEHIFAEIAVLIDLNLDTYADDNGGIGLTPNTPYWYRLRYNLLNGFSAFTDIETATTDA